MSEEEPIRDGHNNEGDAGAGYAKIVAADGTVYKGENYVEHEYPLDEKFLDMEPGEQDDYEDDEELSLEDFKKAFQDPEKSAICFRLYGTAGE